MQSGTYIWHEYSSHMLSHWYLWTCSCAALGPGGKDLGFCYVVNHATLTGVDVQYKTIGSYILTSRMCISKRFYFEVSLPLWLLDHREHTVSSKRTPDCVLIPPHNVSPSIRTWPKASAGCCKFMRQFRSIILHHRICQVDS